MGPGSRALRALGRDDDKLVAGRKRCIEEASPTAPRPAEPHEDPGDAADLSTPQGMDKAAPAPGRRNQPSPARLDQAPAAAKLAFYGFEIATKFL